MRLLSWVGSVSSSMVKVAGISPPPAVKVKFCGSSGSESFTTTSCARLRLANVQVTVSPAATSMFESGLPSLHVALV